MRLILRDHPAAPYLFSLILAVGNPVHAQVIWGPDPQTIPNFVPEGILTGKESSPLDAAEVALYLTTIHQRAALTSAAHPCLVQAVGEGSVSRWSPLTKKLQMGELVLRGEVTEVQPGWSPWLKQTIALVRLRLREVLGGKTTLERGAALSYLQNFGEMEVQGLRACTLPFEADYVAAVGDELILTPSGIDTVNEKLLNLNPRTDIYPIRNGAIVSLSPRLSEEPPEISLQALRTLLPTKQD